MVLNIVLSRLREPDGTCYMVTVEGEKYPKLVRIFSIKRMAFSAALGFLIPLSYAYILSEVSDYTRKTVPDFMVMPFGWPRPLWIFLMNHEPSEADLLTGMLFMAFCNIVLYGTIVYVAVTKLSQFRKTRGDYGSLPQPEQRHS